MAKRPLPPVCECGHDRTFHDKDGCRACRWGNEPYQHVFKQSERRP